MKKILLFKAMALLALLASALSVSAETFKFESHDIYYQLTTYSDGRGVITVENSGAFNTYSGVVNIPDSVEYDGKLYPVTGIGYQAFKNCTGLTAVTIPEGVTMMLNESFAGCTSLTSITLPSTLSTVYNYVFTGCTNLTSITCLRETASSLNANNFDASTYANATLNVPQGSKSSYQSLSAWSQFSKIQEINKFVVDGIYYTVTGGNNVSVTYRDSAFRSYSGTVNVPATVTYHGHTYTVTAVGESAFRDSYAPERDLRVTLPNTVTSIGTYGFYASNLKFIEMGTGLTSIGELAFAETGYTLRVVFCHAMTPPTIYPNTFDDVTYGSAYLWIPRMAFGRYTSARYWSYFNSDNLFYGYDFEVDGVYYGINSYVNTVEVSAYALHTDTTYINSAYSTKQSIIVPPMVTYQGTEYIVNSVGTLAFFKWKTRNISLPNTIKSIEKNAFRYCDSLETINMSEGLTSIGSMAFRDCKLLQSVYIPHSVKSVGYEAFYGCTGLRSLSLGAGVEDIGNYAFRSSADLTSVTSYALIPPVSPQVGSFFAQEVYGQATLRVPMSSVAAYQNAVEWKEFYNIEGMYTLDDALNVPGGRIHFTSEGDYPWQVIVEGDRVYAQSTNAGVHSSSSGFNTTVTVSEPSILSFDFKAWGESAPENPNTTYDECVFISNGTSIFRYGARDNDWENFSMELNPNVTYQLRWCYFKDVSDNGVGDYFAMDNIKIAPKVQRGDVNGDGNVNTADVSALINLLLSGGTPTGGADANQDGNVNTSDVAALIKYLLSGTW